MSNVEHYLFGHVSIKEEYNLYRYQKEVKDILKNNNQKTAFLVGGTGLYIDSVVYNYHLKENQKDVSNLQNLSIKKLQKIIGDNLNKLNESDRNNPHRLIRFIQKGEQHLERGEELKHLYLIYYDDFGNIEENIRRRVKEMFEKGLLEENEKLKEYNLNGTIGYQEFEDYFKGKIDLDGVEHNIYTNTRKYAKRQITWFKRNENAIWVKNYKTAKKNVKNFCNLRC